LRWNVASDVILAWIVTVPAAALFGSAFTNFINFYVALIIGRWAFNLIRQVLEHEGALPHSAQQQPQ
jgi:hypothetical protein